MATNRHAQIRYNILDRCFSNFNRLFNYDDLLYEVNKVLYDIGTEGVKLRQLQYDIKHMESSEGWSIELDDTLKKGRKKAFRYIKKDFSISNHPLNVNDKEQLETTLSILSRYKHREEFNWLEELIPRMRQSFDLIDREENGIISYQENVFLKGREYLGVLFNLILKRKKINIEYQPFHGNLENFIVSPYHLKQYNNRWFLFAKPNDIDAIYNYPLDRIDSIEELPEAVEDVDINWQDYFDDIIGVSDRDKGELVIIKLKFSETRISYVKTKPLHSSQRPDNDDIEGLTIYIEVVPNRELTQLILSFGSDVEVLEPEFLKEQIKEQIERMQSLY